MTVATQQNRYLDRPAPSSLADVIDTILDKGLVIDLYIRVSLVGIELITIDARIVIASVDTYLRWAAAVNRLDLTETEVQGIPELMEDITQAGAKGKTTGALDAAKEKLTDLLGGEEDADDQREKQERRPAKKSTGSQEQRHRRGDGEES